MNRLPFGLSHSIWAWLVLLAFSSLLVVPLLGMGGRLMTARTEASAAAEELARLDMALVQQADRNSDMARAAGLAEAEWRVARDPEAAMQLMADALVAFEQSLEDQQARAIRLGPPQAETLDEHTQSLTSEITFIVPADEALAVLSQWDTSAFRLESFSLLALADGSAQIRLRLTLVVLRDEAA